MIDHGEATLTQEKKGLPSHLWAHPRNLRVQEHDIDGKVLGDQQRTIA